MSTSSTPISSSARSPALSASAPSAAQKAHGGITAIVVPDEQRLDFLPKHFGWQMLVFENAVYDWMRTLCPAYGGGFWDYVELSNGGAYMRFKTSDAELQLNVDGNGYSGLMSPDAASLVACMFAVNRLLFKGRHELAGLYDQLYDYGAQHPEARAIFAAID